MAGNIAPKIVLDGLLMYLDAGNTKSYIGSGTTLTDISGKDRNAVLVNGPTFSSSNIGSIVFDGIDDFASIVTTPKWFPMSTSTFTLDVWVKTNGLPTGNVSGLISLTYGITLSIIKAGGGVYFRVYDNSLLVLNNLSSTGINCNDGKWHHIVGTNDGLTSKIYIDGVFNNSMSAPFYGDVPSAWYGSTYGLGVEANITTTTKLPGNISIVKVYNKALSAQEVLQNYNATKSRFI